MTKHTLFAYAAILSLACAPLAHAQVAVNGPQVDAANSTSNSGAESTSTNVNLNGGNSVGPIDSSVRVGPTTADSNSTAQSGSLSSSQSQGGAGGTATSTSQATGGTATTGPSSASATASPNASNAGNAQSITFNSTAPKHQTLKAAPQVYAPAMTTTLTETCMGSTSVGASVVGFGGSFGSTWNDDQCVRRLNAREMAQTLGDRDAARALLCQDKDVAAAYLAIGQSCFQKVDVIAQVIPPAPVAEQAPPAPEPPKQATMAPIPNPPSGGNAESHERCTSGANGECGTAQ